MKRPLLVGHVLLSFFAGIAEAQTRRRELLAARFPSPETDGASFLPWPFFLLLFPINPKAGHFLSAWLVAKWTGTHWVSPFFWQAELPLNRPALSPESSPQHLTTEGFSKKRLLGLRPPRRGGWETRPFGGKALGGGSYPAFDIVTSVFNLSFQKRDPPNIFGWGFFFLPLSFEKGGAFSGAVFLPLSEELKKQKTYG